MADAQIQILIEAQDKISATLESIQNKMGILAEKSRQSSEKISLGFTQTTDKLLALGNVASAFDAIQSTQINTQIRLENAQDRVQNSIDRLYDAKLNLKKVTEDGTSSEYDLIRAQNEVERSTRGLEIAQNNQKRVMESLIGTYINMGIQTITLIASIPKAVEGFIMLTNAIKSFDIAAIIGESILNPFATAAIVAAAAVGVYAISNLMAAESATKLTNTQTNLGISFAKTTSTINAQKEAIKQLQQTTQAYDNFLARKRTGPARAEYGTDANGNQVLIVATPYGPAGGFSESAPEEPQPFDLDAANKIGRQFMSPIIRIPPNASLPIGPYGGAGREQGTTIVSIQLDGKEMGRAVAIANQTSLVNKISNFT